MKTPHFVCQSNELSSWSQAEFWLIRGSLITAILSGCFIYLLPSLSLFLSDFSAGDFQQSNKSVKVYGFFNIKWLLKVIYYILPLTIKENFCACFLVLTHFSHKILIFLKFFNFVPSCDYFQWWNVRLFRIYIYSTLIPPKY